MGKDIFEGWDLLAMAKRPCQQMRSLRPGIGNPWTMFGSARYLDTCPSLHLTDKFPRDRLPTESDRAAAQSLLLRKDLLWDCSRV